MGIVVAEFPLSPDGYPRGLLASLASLSSARTSSRSRGWPAALFEAITSWHTMEDRGDSADHDIADVMRV